MFRKLLDRAQAGDNIGALLRGIKREDVERGQVLAKPGSITPHTGFKAEAYILTKEEGGRHTPFFTNYRPQFYFRTTDVTGIVKLPEGVEMVMPGDNVTMDVELIAPIAMDAGPALRHPRGWPHRRRRRRRADREELGRQPAPAGRPAAGLPGTNRQASPSRASRRSCALAGGRRSARWRGAVPGRPPGRPGIGANPDLIAASAAVPIGLPAVARPGIGA